MPDGTGTRIESVERAVEVLEAVRRREGAGVTELAAALGLPKSTVHHHLATLRETGCLEQVDGEYRLGLRLLTFGGQARERERLYRLAREEVDRLAEETDEQARLLVERDGVGVTVYQAAGDAVESTCTHAGSTEALHCTAAGKAFLAALPAERRAALLDERELTAHTDATITDRGRLRAELEEVRSRGVAFDDGERYEGVRCVAASITDSTGELLGAISVSGPADRLPDERFRAEIPTRLQTVAGVVEVNTTYSGWSDVSS